MSSGLQDAEPRSLSADVLVLGGGPAGAWAAIEAAEAGATVVLADKGRVGTSGATAAANTAVIDVAPGTWQHDTVMRRRRDRGLGLVDVGTVTRTLQDTHERLTRLGEWGYRYPSDDRGRPYRGTLRGPDYMQVLRRRLAKLGVRLLDHCPATHLLAHDGCAAGASGLDRRTGVPWRVQAGAVVIATGGCAFMSRALGTYGLTGDGLLMAAEAGATLSGLEFSGQYGIAHADATVTKNLIYEWATFTDRDGRVLDGDDDKFALLARYLPEGPVFAVIDKADAAIQEGLRRGQPNIFLALDRQGIDPFRDRFPVTLIYEGTVRGVGGVAIDRDGATRVPGLFAAGDAASREPLVGAVSGGGGPNSTWAIASGSRAGQGAAHFAEGLGPLQQTRGARRIGAVRRSAPDRNRYATELVQGWMFPLHRNFTRDGAALAEGRRSLDETWWSWRDNSTAPNETPGLCSREAEAMMAVARMICAAAATRRETRGMHRRRDCPAFDAGQTHSLHVTGVDEIRVAPAEAAP